MSQPGSRNNRVRALSVRPITPPPPLPQIGELYGTNDDRPPQSTDCRDPSTADAHQRQENWSRNSRQRSQGGRTRASSVRSLGAADDGNINTDPQPGSGGSAETDTVLQVNDGTVVAEVVFDEIDEVTGDNIVVEAPIPPEEAEFVAEKLKADGIPLQDSINLALLANYSMVSRSRTWKEWFVFMQPCLLVAGFTFLSACGRTLLSNQLPFMLRDYFGSAQHAAMVQTTADATRAGLAMLLVPTYGSLLDSVGRKPFFVITSILNTLPTTFALAIPSNPLFALVFYEVSQLLSITYYLAYITDMYSDGRDRAKVMAVVTGLGSMSPLISIVGAFATPQTAIWVAWGIMMVRVPFACFGFKESLEPSQRREFSWKLVHVNPLPAIRSISGNRVLVGVTFIVASLLIAAIGASELMSYYLQLKIAWTETDAYDSGLESGIVGPFILLVVYPFLSKVVRPSRIVLIAYACVLVSLLSLILLYEKWEVFAITFVFANTINIGVPPLLAIFSTAGEGNDQGQRLAGITAVMDLMNALVPLAVGQLFSHIPQRLSWITFAICFLAAIPGFATCAIFLPKWIASDRKQTLSKSLSAPPAGYSAGH